MRASHFVTARAAMDDNMVTDARRQQVLAQMYAGAVKLLIYFPLQYCNNKCVRLREHCLLPVSWCRQQQLIQIMGPIDGMESALIQWENLAYKQSGGRLVLTIPSRLSSTPGPAVFTSAVTVLSPSRPAGSVHTEGGDAAAEDQGQGDGAAAGRGRAGAGAATAAGSTGALPGPCTGKLHDFATPALEHIPLSWMPDTLLCLCRQRPQGIPQPAPGRLRHSTASIPTSISTSSPLPRPW